jgi:hypothetical protein
MHHYSHEKSNEEEHASHCNHDKESSCTLRKVVTADVEHNHQSDEANMKLGGLKRSFAHYSPWNTDDDIMQARRPVATTEYAAAPSTTDAFSSSKAFFRKELVPAQQYLHTTGGGIESMKDGKKRAVAARANVGTHAIEHSKASFPTNEVHTYDHTRIELGTPYPRISRETRPGAIAVSGVDSAREEYGEEFSVSPTATSHNNLPTQHQSNEPISAELIDAAEEERKRREQVDEEVQLKLAEREKRAPVAEIVRPQKCGRRTLFITGIVILLVLAVAVVISVMLLRQGDNSPEDGSPTPAPTIPVPTGLTDLLSSVSFDRGAALSNSSTPQYSALIWLANNTNLDMYSNKQKIQRYALATFYYSTNGDKWNNKSGWLSDADECEWYNSESFNDIGGSFCRDGELVGLVMVEVDTFSGNNLDGTIPNEIALISNSLEQMILFYNKLTGPIPSEIGLMKALNILALGFNSLSGTIPTEVGLLTHLLMLELSLNKLLGTIPTEIGALTSLSELFCFS